MRIYWSIEQTGQDAYRLISKGGQTALSLSGNGQAPLLQTIGAA